MEIIRAFLGVGGRVLAVGAGFVSPLRGFCLAKGSARALCAAGDVGYIFFTMCWRVVGVSALTRASLARQRVVRVR